MTYSKSYQKRKSNKEVRTDNIYHLDYKHSKIQTEQTIRPRTGNQKNFVNAMVNNKYTLGLGSPGCGKSLLSLYQAICEYNSETSPIDKIVYIRANVGNDEEDDIGALPGEYGDKVSKLAYPVYDNCREFMKDSQCKAMFEFEKMEVMIVRDARGRSFSNTFVIVDEAQNIGKKGLVTLLTRMSHGSKLVMIGDPKQCDLSYNEHYFRKAANKLRNLPNFDVVYFEECDIVRDPLIADIVKVFDNL